MTRRRLSTLLRARDDLVRRAKALPRPVRDRALEQELAGTRAALDEARHLFERAFEDAPIGIALVDLDGHFIRVNRALCQITGYTAGELLKRTFTEITHPDDVEADVEQNRRLLGGELRDYQMETRSVNSSGDTIWVRLSVALVRGPDAAPHYFITQVQDISAQKQMERELRGLADHDALTGLPNRRYFEEALGRQIRRCRRYGETATLMMLDLDGFKQVNDRYGHRAGDDLLRAVASAIRGRIRSSDVAARFGGDEFAVLLLHTGDGTLSVVAEDLRRAIGGAVIEVAGAQIAPSASVGIAELDETAVDGTAALASADRAMYLDKRRRRE